MQCRVSVLYLLVRCVYGARPAAFVVDTVARKVIVCSVFSLFWNELSYGQPLNFDTEYRPLALIDCHWSVILLVECCIVQS